VTERATSGRESFPGFRLTLSIAAISRSIAPISAPKPSKVLNPRFRTST